MQYVLLIAGSLIMLPPQIAAASTLNKCIDASGRITYSNLPCQGSYKAHTLEIDPPPLPDPVRPLPKVQSFKPERSTLPASSPTPSEPRPETRRGPGKTATEAMNNKCNTISDKLGRVFDKMDTARRHGYTQEQMNNWNQQVKDLERQKQQAGCF